MGAGHLSDKHCHVLTGTATETEFKAALTASPSFTSCMLVKK